VLKFLKQDIPGEPMAGGVNLWRLQQILERVSQSPGLDREPPAASPALPSFRMDEEQSIEVARENIPPPGEAAPSSESEADPEITAIEADIQRLQAVAEDLQARLEQARQRVRISSGVKLSQEIKQPVARLPESNTSPRSSEDDWFLEFLE
jgi:hypothetical protein